MTTSTDRPLDPAPPRSSERNLSVWAVARRWRTMLLAAAVAAGLAGYAVGAGGHPTYEAKAVLLVGPINTDLDTVKAAGQLAQTYAQLATTQPVLAATAQKLSLRDVSGEVSASANGVTRLLTITVKDRDRLRATRIASTHAQELVALAAKRESGSPTDPGELQVVEPAQASGGPVGPGALPIGLAAALVGLLGALGVAVVLDRSSGAVRDVSDITAATGTGAIATLSTGTLRAGPGSALVVREPSSRGAQEIRRLAAKLRAVGERSLLILEVDDRAVGVAANLAVALTAGGRSVALIDGGEDAGSRVPDDLADGVSVHPAPLDGGPAAHQALLEELMAHHDVVVIRAPGIDRSPAGLSWGRLADGTILVAGVDRTSREDLVSTVESLRLVHGRVLGTVLGAGSPFIGRR
ncbi:hypothetical protein [Baekduia soli]|uniref:hypothetical protein n=1 Tax=Baekduia soli TaxID=496014 RepID=UPI001652AA06|nr:hypothetical protein [Baekduia soli]